MDFHWFLLRSFIKKRFTNRSFYENNNHFEKYILTPKAKDILMINSTKKYCVSQDNMFLFILWGIFYKNGIPPIWELLYIQSEYG